MTGRLSSPLHLAAGFNNIETAKLLLAKGANVDMQDQSGLFPLHNAVSFGHEEMAHLLITHGSNINATDNFSYTPLHGGR